MIKEMSGSRWDELAEAAPWWSLFHSIAWAELWTRTFGWGRPRLLTWEPDGTPTAIVPLYEFRNKLVSVPGCEYGGIIPLEDGVTIRGFLAELDRCFDKPILMRFHPQIATENEPGNDTFHDLTRLHTYLLDIRPDPDRLLGSFRNTTRHSIERSLESDLVVERGGGDLVDEFYEPYLGSMKHNRAIPYPRSFYRGLATVFDTDDWDIYVAANDGSVVSSILVLHHGDLTHYFKAGNTPTGYEMDANPLLLWNAIVDARERGSRQFDFGATPPDSGNDTFKRGFRGEKHPITTIGIGRAAARQHRLAREGPLKDLWGRLPPWLMERLSPLALRLTV